MNDSEPASNSNPAADPNSERTKVPTEGHGATSEDSPVETRASEPPHHGSTFISEPGHVLLSPGARFGRYVIESLLGKGAMGAVYAALDTKLERKIALKIPFFKAGAEPAVVERFEREARAAADLRHSSICPIFDVGEIDGVHFLTMGFIPGVTLAQKLTDERRLSLRQAFRILKAIASALHHAHTHGIVHRDLKPANIMMDDADEPVITDFGLARRHGANEQKLTQTGMLIGTPAYMAPEQILGRPELIGPRSDLFAIGVILYEMLAGSRPFQGHDLSSLLYQIAHEPPPPLSKRLIGLPLPLEAIVMRLLAKDVNNRFQSAAELQSALNAIEPYLDATVSAPPADLAELRQQLDENEIVKGEQFDRILDRIRGAGSAQASQSGGHDVLGGIMNALASRAAHDVESASGEVAIEAMLKALSNPDTCGGEALLTPYQCDALHVGGAAALRCDKLILLKKIDDDDRGELFLGRRKDAPKLSLVRLLSAKNLAMRSVEAMGAWNARMGELARIKHPALPAIKAYGVSNGRAFVVFDLIDGVSLRDRVGSDEEQREPPELPVAVQWTQSVAEALSLLHDHNLCHHRLGADSIFIRSDDSVLLLDVEVAGSLGADGPNWRQLGPPFFRAPEEWQPLATPTPASNIYSLGALFFLMASGRPPFAGSDLTELSIQHRQSAPPKLSNRCPTATASLDGVVLKALAKNPAQRFPSMRTFAAELKQSVERRNSTLLATGLGVVAIVVVATVIVWNLQGPLGTESKDSIAKKPAEKKVETPHPVPSPKPAPEPPTAQELLKQGNEALAAGNLDTAIERFLSGQKLANSEADGKQFRQSLAAAYARKGEHWIEDGHFADAIAAFKNARTYSDDPSALNGRMAIAYFRYGEQFAASGNRTEALKDFDAALQHDPKLAPALKARLAIALETADIDAAVADLRRLLQLDSKDEVSKRELLKQLLLRGDKLLAAGNSKAALDDANEALTIDERSAPAYAFRSRLLLKSGEPQHALVDLQLAAKLDPNNGDYVLDQAAILAKIGDDMIKSATQRYSAGDTAGARADYLAAADKLLEARKLAPQAKDYAIGASRAFVFAGNIDYSSDVSSALANYQRALDTDPDSVDARKFVSVAKQAIAAGKKDEARRLVAEEKFADAVRLYEDSLNDNPNDIDVLKQLTFFYAAGPKPELRNGPKAVVRAKKLCELTDQKQWGYLLLLADAYAQDGKFDDAKRIANEALKLAPEADKQTVQVHLGFINNNQPIP